ncbi:glyoxalase superfamily protein [Chitinibacteraceae bacterium HSL-7]
MSSVIPILRAFDEATTLAFYVDFLGFKVDWQHRFEPQLPLYLQISRGDCVLHLSQHHGDCCPGGAVIITVADVEALCNELASRPYGFARPAVIERPWGARDLELRDPAANRLIFSQPSQ